MIARGQFDIAQIGALASMKGSSKESYEGVDVYTGTRRATKAFAFPEPTIALIGDAVSVKAAIDNRRQCRRSRSAIVNQTSGREQPLRSLVRIHRSTKDCARPSLQFSRRCRPHQRRTDTRVRRSVERRSCHA